MGVVFVEMILEVLGGGTRGKGNKLGDEEKQEDNLGEVACHSDDQKAPRDAFCKSSCLTLYLKNWSVKWCQQGCKLGSSRPALVHKNAKLQTE